MGISHRIRTADIPEQSSLTVVAKEHSVPYHTLMALQRNNKALHNTVILERYCSTTQSCCPPSRDQQPDRLQISMDFSNAGVTHPLSLRWGTPGAEQLQAQRCCASVAPMLRPAGRLLSASTARDREIGRPDDDLALKLHWGRQRGIAVIFAADAIECARRESERYFLGESMLESAAVGIASEQYIQDDAACTVSITPLPKVPSDSELPQAQLEPDGKSGSDLFCTKLAIPEDACSVDGPPTPDNEEADRVCMPAAKRQRLDESSPTAAALAVARILQLI
ncbi:g3452 [Coccomyxa viridis]|uniref:G3452 protein n=1 Tax=Coccomyxa viridis TaxID=1274662 RepID=A0ABP1FT63_9CHLO